MMSSQKATNDILFQMIKNKVSFNKITATCYYLETLTTF